MASLGFPGVEAGGDAGVPASGPRTVESGGDVGAGVVGWVEFAGGGVAGTTGGLGVLEEGVGVVDVVSVGVVGVGVVGVVVVGVVTVPGGSSPVVVGGSVSVGPQ